MPFRSDISVDFGVSPRIITVAAPSTELDLQDLVDTLRTIEADLPSLDDEFLLSAAGKQNLGGGLQVGITVTLNNAKIAFEGRAGPATIQMRVSGGNLVAIDDLGADLDPVEPTAFTQVVIAQSSSATISNLTVMEAAVQLVEKIFRNRQITDPASGQLTIYDDDSITPLLEGQLYEDALGTITYRGRGAERRERLETPSSP